MSLLLHMVMQPRMNQLLFDHRNGGQSPEKWVTSFSFLDDTGLPWITSGTKLPDAAEQRARCRTNGPRGAALLTGVRLTCRYVGQYKDSIGFLGGSIRMLMVKAVPAKLIELFTYPFGITRALQNPLSVRTFGDLVIRFNQALNGQVRKKTPLVDPKAYSPPALPNGTMAEARGVPRERGAVLPRGHGNGLTHVLVQVNVPTGFRKVFVVSKITRVSMCPVPLKVRTPQRPLEGSSEVRNVARHAAQRLLDVT